MSFLQSSGAIARHANEFDIDPMGYAIFSFRLIFVSSQVCAGISSCYVSLVIAVLSLLV